MIISLKKFGTLLVSRQAGKEALAAFQPTLSQIDPNEPIAIDFEGVVTFSPSWGDEFLTPLIERFKNRCTFRNTSNPSVTAAIKFLEEIQGYKM
jgi:hypothetical protein